MYVSPCFIITQQTPVFYFFFFLSCNKVKVCNRADSELPTDIWCLQSDNVTSYLNKLCFIQWNNYFTPELENLDLWILLFFTNIDHNPLFQLHCVLCLFPVCQLEADWIRALKIPRRLRDKQFHLAAPFSWVNEAAALSASSPCSLLSSLCHDHYSPGLRLCFIEEYFQPG